MVVDVIQVGIRARGIESLESSRICRFFLFLAAERKVIPQYTHVHIQFSRFAWSQPCASCCTVVEDYGCFRRTALQETERSLAGFGVDGGCIRLLRPEEGVDVEVSLFA